MSPLRTIPSLSTRLMANGRSGSARPRRLREINVRGECPGQSVLALLEEHAQHHPLNRALVMLEGGRTRAVTYVELAQRVKGLAAWLVERYPEGGESIAILSESSPAWGIVALATIASRNVLVPLDPGMERDALDATLRSVRPAILFASGSRFEAVRALAGADAPATELLRLDHSRVNVPTPDAPAAARAPGRIEPTPGTALLAFTSGSTGAPKAVEISFDNLLFQIRALTGRFALRPSDRFLSLLPMHHMFELTVGFLCPLWAGAQIHYLHSMIPDEGLEHIRALGITRVVTVPAWLRLLQRTLEGRAQSDGGSCAPALRNHARQAFGAEFEHFVSGGAPLPDTVFDFFDAIGAPVVEGYGLTEAGPVVATNTVADRRRGSVGRQLRGSDVAIDGSGEVLVRGPQVAGFYRLDTGAAKSVTDDKGWFHTGDLGYVDADGRLYVTGRIKSTIVLASGKNVQPEEIESCVLACEGVAEAAAVAVEDAGNGESICLVAVPAPGYLEACRDPGGDVDQVLRGLVHDAFESLAPHKRPTRIVFTQTPLPRTGSGKLRRPALRDLARPGSSS